jgi:glycine cleavage system transcriptional repressor
VVSVDAGGDQVEDAVGGVVAPLGLRVTVTPVTDEELDPQGAHYVLTLHGADRPGIVAAIAELLADAGCNITELTTRLTGTLYVLVCEVDLPQAVDVGDLGTRLDALGEQLGVHVALHAAEADVL